MPTTDRWQAGQKEALLPHYKLPDGKTAVHSGNGVNIGIPIRLGSAVTLTFFVLTCIWVSAYMLSLQGGDLLFINKNLGIMGAEILVSVLSLTAITMTLYMHRLHRRMRWNMMLATLALLALLYVYDHGERFEEHGFYNLLVLMLILVPLNITIALLYVMFVTVPNFARILLFTTVIVVCGATAMLRHYMDVFGKGTFGRMRDIPGECAWQGNNLPLVDLLPSGTQNFWAGGMHCRAENIPISASFDDAGFLHVNCTSGSVFVDILPQTRRWPLLDKSKWQVFNHRVLDRMERKKYDTPMLMDSQTQSVVVRCGSSSKIVTRVSPRISQLPEYVPPTDSDTRAKDRHRPYSKRKYEQRVLSARRPNVMFIFVDATSHRQFYRRLKQTAATLATLHQPGKTALTELYRYHSLGVSTDNSTKAMYLGEIFPKIRNPLPIWAYYRDRGYVTARVETSCEDWSRTYAAKYYNSLLYSVGERSLDYELSAPFCMPEYYPATGNSFGNFKGPFSISARCLYGRHVHEYGFDYIDQLREELGSDSSRNNSKPYMLMLNLMEGHEGTGEVIRTLDGRLSMFLADLRDSGELDDTVLFLLSDHGLHMGLNYAFLNSGQIEHKNPFFAMVLPQWLRSHVDIQAAQGLLVNEQRLTTPLETYYTLKTLADWPAYEPSDFKRSLFAPVKAGRTCAEANIGANICMCR